MKKKLTTGFIVALFLVGIVGVADAALITYNNESDYLSAISSYDIVIEGFESSDWDPSRPDGTTSITSQGLTWTGGDSIRTGTGWARSGVYGVFDSFGAPDTISSVTGNTLYGFGGWFDQTTAQDLTFSIDGADVYTVGLSGINHSFYGVVETDGFTSMVLSTSSGHWGADDFTVASGSAAPVPEPSTILLMGAGLLGLVGYNRKRFSKKS